MELWPRLGVEPAPHPAFSLSQAAAPARLPAWRLWHSVGGEAGQAVREADVVMRIARVAASILYPLC